MSRKGAPLAVLVCKNEHWTLVPFAEELEMETLARALRLSGSNSPSDLILSAERVLRADPTAQPYEHALALLALQRAVKEAKKAMENTDGRDG